MKLNRRNFLKQGSVLGASLAMSSTIASGMLSACAPGKKPLEKFGLQLYTLRDVIANDPKEILKQVASFGYKQIESYSGPSGIFWGMTNVEFKKYMDDLGMSLVSSHCGIGEGFEKLAAEAGGIGMKYLITPSDEDQKTLDDFKRTAEKYNERGKVCKQNGLRFAYHNHDFIFKEVEGRIPLEVLLEFTDPDLVDFELDLYWAVTAGQNPVEWLNAYKNRFKLGHVKDRKKDTADREATCTLGEGSIDYSSILTVAKESGMEYFIVEQEHYENNSPLGCAKDDATYLSRLAI